MKRLLKKEITPPTPWHPDFRDQNSLPDVKVVRTSFFVNGVSVLVLMGFLLMAGTQELERHGLAAEIQTLEERIESNRKRNSEVLRLHSAFQKEERFITEVTDYLEDSLDLSRFLVALGHSIPSGMKITSLTYQDASTRMKTVEKEMLISGSIEGARDRAASVVTQYLNVFAVDPLFAEIVERAVSTSMVPMEKEDQMAFAIRLTMKGPDAEEEEEKGKSR